MSRHVTLIEIRESQVTINKYYFDSIQLAVITIYVRRNQTHTPNPVIILLFLRRLTHADIYIVVTGETVTFLTDGKFVRVECYAGDPCVYTY